MVPGSKQRHQLEFRKGVDWSQGAAKGSLYRSIWTRRHTERHQRAYQCLPAGKRESRIGRIQTTAKEINLTRLNCFFSSLLADRHIYSTLGERIYFLVFAFFSVCLFRILVGHDNRGHKGRFLTILRKLTRTPNVALLGTHNVARQLWWRKPLVLPTEDMTSVVKSGSLATNLIPRVLSLLHPGNMVA